MMIPNRRQPQVLDLQVAQAHPYSMGISSTPLPDFSTNNSGSSASDSSSNSWKSVIGYASLAVAFLAVLLFIARRFRKPRPATVDRSFNVGQHYSAYLPPNGPSLVSPIGSALPPRHLDGFSPNRHPELHYPGVPTAYLGRGRQSNTADVLDGWRRSRNCGLCHDGTLGDKDSPPVYDKGGGPPNYVDLDTTQMQAHPLQSDGLGDPWAGAATTTLERDGINNLETTGEREGGDGDLEQQISSPPCSPATEEPSNSPPEIPVNPVGNDSADITHN